MSRHHPAKVATAGVLLPLAIVGALWMSASATVALAARHGVPAGATQVAAVAMLEVVSLTGALLWVVAPSYGLRRDAAVATVAAAGVTAVAGWQEYDWFGVWASLALPWMVHVASKAWRDNWRPTAGGEVATEGSAPILRPEPVAAKVEPEEFAEEASSAALAVPDPDTDPTPVLPDVPGISPAVVAQAAELLEQVPSAGRPRLIDELGVNDHKAKKLLAALRPMRAVEGEAA